MPARGQHKPWSKRQPHTAPKRPPAPSPAPMPEHPLAHLTRDRRPCLGHCNKSFLSTDEGNRICPACRARNTGLSMREVEPHRAGQQ